MKIIPETWTEFFELMEEYYETPNYEMKNKHINGKLYNPYGIVIEEKDEE